MSRGPECMRPVRTLDQVGAIMGISKARVCQIEADMFARLGASMAALRDDPVLRDAAEALGVIR